MENVIGHKTDSKHCCSARGFLGVFFSLPSGPPNPIFLGESFADSSDPVKKSMKNQGEEKSINHLVSSLGHITVT